MVAKRATVITVVVVSLVAGASACGSDNETTTAGSDSRHTTIPASTSSSRSDRSSAPTTDGSQPATSGSGSNSTGTATGPPGPSNAAQVSRLLDLLGAGVFESPGGAEIRLYCSFETWGERIAEEMNALVADGKVDPSTVSSIPSEERTDLEARWLELAAMLTGRRPLEWSPWTPVGSSVGGQGICLYGMGGASPVTLTLRDTRGAEVTTVTLRDSGSTTVIDNEGGVQGEVAVLVFDRQSPVEIVGFATTPNSRYGSPYRELYGLLGLASTPGVTPGAQILLIPSSDGPQPASFTAVSGEGSISGTLS